MRCHDVGRPSHLGCPVEGPLLIDITMCSSFKSFIGIQRVLQANKMVLVYNQFRLATVIEAAMEIAGMQAAQKRLQVRLSVPQAYSQACKPPKSACRCA